MPSGEEVPLGSDEAVSRTLCGRSHSPVRTASRWIIYRLRCARSLKSPGWSRSTVGTTKRLAQRKRLSTPWTRRLCAAFCVIQNRAGTLAEGRRGLGRFGVKLREVEALAYGHSSQPDGSNSRSAHSGQNIRTSVSDSRSTPARRYALQPVANQSLSTPQPRHRKTVSVRSILRVAYLPPGS
jgi:hypothetical protein